MSIFPRRILLATDGSLDAQLAATTAADAANSTGSELHLRHRYRRGLGRVVGGRPDSDGQPGIGRDKKSSHGQRLRFSGSPRPLPGAGDASGSNRVGLTA
jgi:hypothetical protein